MPISGSSSIGNQASLAAATNKTANTEFLAADISVGLRSDRSGKLRVTVSLVTPGVFQVTLDSGTTWVSLNNAVLLTANALHVFDVPIFSGDLVNFRTSVTSDVNIFRADEVLMEG